MFLAFIYPRGVSQWVGAGPAASSGTKDMQTLARSRHWVMKQFVWYALLLLAPLVYATVLLAVLPDRVRLPGLFLMLGSTTAAKFGLAICTIVFIAATTCIFWVLYIAWQLPGHYVLLILYCTPESYYLSPPPTCA